MVVEASEIVTALVPVAVLIKAFCADVIVAPIPEVTRLIWFQFAAAVNPVAVERLVALVVTVRISVAVVLPT